jgi:hypothetical protein
MDFARGRSYLNDLVRGHCKEKVTNNLAFIIEETRKQLLEERNRLSEKIFRDLIDKKNLWFFLLADKGIEFQIIDEKEWQKRINEIFAV